MQGGDGADLFIFDYAFVPLGAAGFDSLGERHAKSGFARLRMRYEAHSPAAQVRGRPPSLGHPGAVRQALTYLRFGPEGAGLGDMWNRFRTRDTDFRRT